MIIVLISVDGMAFLAAVKEGKLRTFIGPGAKLTVSAEIVHEGSGFAMTETKIFVDKKLACNATLTFRHLPFPHDELRKHMTELAHRIQFPFEVLKRA